MAAPLKLCGLDLNLDGDGYIFDGDAKDGDDDGEIENTNENGDGTAAAAAAAASGTDEGKEEVENRHADAVRNTTVVIPKDILEREALKVPAPAVSRTPLIPGVSGLFSHSHSRFPCKPLVIPDLLNCSQTPLSCSLNSFVFFVFLS